MNDRTIVSTEFQVFEARDSLLPEIILFRASGVAYRAEVHYEAGWTKNVSYGEVVDDVLYFIQRGERKMILIKQGRKISRYVFLPLADENKIT